MGLRPKNTVLLSESMQSITAVDLSTDHKPDNPLEKQRIEQAGGCVDHRGRCSDKQGFSSIAVSRAIGDLNYKNNPNL
jgi:serine/threonine protein phosphatase PrpC